jgi:AcrR family transcriptional regulator
MSSGAPTATVPIAPRLTQPERVEAMRARLLDATVDCLVDHGYAELSTNDVVRRAGVSRGALAHHFPTKAELVAAAGERLIEQRTAEFRASFSTMAPSRRTIAQALDLLWSYYEGPTFAALLELIVAARTNPELRGVLAEGPERITAAALEVFVDFFPEFTDNPLAGQMVRAVVALLGGLALQAIVDEDRQGHHAAVRELIKTLSAVVLPGKPK